ncbi:MAG TPA: SpoIIE family protein phosphatase [Terracidiphilus sp.]|nr:SpoIIE family protein phosphatase [Terracidiphilus sp.]
MGTVVRSVDLRYAVQPPIAPSVRKLLSRLVVTFAAYFVAGKIGLAIPFTSANVSPLWMPAGLALAAMLVWGRRVWPAIALGAFAVNYFSGLPFLVSVGLGVGNTAGAFCGVLLLQRTSDFQWSLPRLRDVLRLTILGALCGSAVSATLGTLVLFIAGVNAWSGFRSAWLMWWLGDALGVLMLTPLLLTVPGVAALRREHRLSELACLGAVALGACLVVFNVSGESLRPEVFAFGVFPFVLWGAIRFEAMGAAAVSFLVAGTAVWGTAHGFGPFVHGDAFQNAATLQAFLAVTAVSGMTLAAAIAERGRLERERSEIETREKSEEKYRRIVQTASEGIWTIDADFTTSYVNPRMASLLGYTIEEMQGKSIFDFLMDGDVEQKRSDFQRREGGVSEEIERRYRRKDGSVLWARVATSPMFAADGAFEGALAMVSDITLQKKTDAEASRSQETISLMSSAVHQTADVVVITDRLGKILYVNPAFQTTTGYTPAEALGNTPRLLKSGSHEPEFYNSLWRRLLQGETFTGTIVNRKKCGQLYWTEQTITPIKTATGETTHFVSVHKDITELQKRNEQELQLRIAQQVQQRFYAGAAISVLGFDIATVACPANETGGDYLDLFSLPDGRICIGIGDVSGHGLGSALIMALTRAYVRAFAQVETDPASILNRVNRMLVADLDNDRYVTLLLVCLDRVSGSLSYASAGHVPGFVLGHSGQVESILESSGIPLGLFGDAQYVTSTVPFAPQSLLIMMTDGVIEASPGPEDKQFATAGVLEYVREHRQDTTRDLAEGVCGAARTFAENKPQTDDITAVLVQACELETVNRAERS